MIYLSGKVMGYYRAQSIIKILGDNRIQYVNYPFYLAVGKFKLLKIITALLTFCAFFLLRILTIIKAKKVIVLPMNFSWIVLFEVFFARLLKKDVIVEYYISNYDTLVNDKQRYKKRTVSAKIALLKDKFITHYASVIICLNRSEADYYSFFMSANAKHKIRTIPLVCYSRQKRCYTNNESDKCLNVFWWGTYIPLHGLEKVIKAMAYTNNVNLHIFGNDEVKSKRYKSLAEVEGVTKKVTFYDNMTFANGKLEELIHAKCDVALGNFGDSNKAKTVLVNKIVDCSSLGLATITMKTKALQEFYRDNESIILTDSDEKSIAKCLNFYAENKKLLRVIAKGGFEVYKNNFSEKAFAKEYVKIINE